MVAMIPYLPQPVWHIGPLTIPAFGVAAGSALITSYCMVIARATAVGVSSLRAGRIFVAVVLSGLLAGYLWNGGGSCDHQAIAGDQGRPNRQSEGRHGEGSEVPDGLRQVRNH